MILQIEDDYQHLDLVRLQNALYPYLTRGQRRVHLGRRIKIRKQVGSSHWIACRGRNLRQKAQLKTARHPYRRRDPSVHEMLRLHQLKIYDSSGTQIWSRTLVYQKGNRNTGESRGNDHKLNNYWLFRWIHRSRQPVTSSATLSRIQKKHSQSAYDLDSISNNKKRSSSAERHRSASLQNLEKNGEQNYVCIALTSPMVINASSY